MAARTRRAAPGIEMNERWKNRIKTVMLLDRLMDHILTDGGLLTSTQVRAAEILLRKTMPDLAHTTGTVEHNLVDDLTQRLMEAKQNADSSRTIN